MRPINGLNSCSNMKTQFKGSISKLWLKIQSFVNWICGQPSTHTLTVFNLQEQVHEKRWQRSFAISIFNSGRQTLERNSTNKFHPQYLVIFNGSSFQSGFDSLNVYPTDFFSEVRNEFFCEWWFDVIWSNYSRLSIFFFPVSKTYLEELFFMIPNILFVFRWLHNICWVQV